MQAEISRSLQYPQSNVSRYFFKLFFALILSHSKLLAVTLVIDGWQKLGVSRLLTIGKLVARLYEIPVLCIVERLH
jgi:hypothetical protein